MKSPRALFADGTNTYPAPDVRFSTTARVLYRPSMALTEQVCVSGANFFLNAALARALGASGYGCFATAFVCALFVSVLHNGALLDPISIVAPSRRNGIEPGYIGAQLRAHVRSSALLALLPAALAIVTYAAGADTRLPIAFVACSATLPVVLLLPLARRVLLVGRRNGAAAVSAGIYAFAVVTGYWLLSAHLHVNVLSAYLLLAAASLLGSCVLFHSYGWRAIAHAVRLSTSAIDIAAVEQRRQARSLVPAAALTFAMTQVQLPAVSLLLGTADAGLYRAMQLPAVGIGQVMTAVATLALPWLASAFGSGDEAAFRTRTRHVVLVLLLVAGAAEVLLLATYPYISAALYGSSFVESSWLMPVMGLVGLASCAGTGLGLALRASQRSHLQFRATVLMAGIGAPLAIALTATAGLPGAAVSTVLNYLLFSVVIVRLFSGNSCAPREQSIGTVAARAQTASR